MTAEMPEAGICPGGSRTMLQEENCFGGGRVIPQAKSRPGGRCGRQGADICFCSQAFWEREDLYWFRFWMYSADLSCRQWEMAS